jgi:hypothetical protein
MASNVLGAGKMSSKVVPFVKYESICSLVETEDVKQFGKSDFKVFEKIDGGNCQIRRQDWNLYPGNRANFLKGPKVKSLPWFGKFVGWTYSNSSLYQLPENLIVFGEWSGNHTIDYSPLNNDKFFVIDVLDLNKNRFMDYDCARVALDEMGIKGVHFLPILHEGPVSPNELEVMLQERSDYYDGPKEGLVLKDYSADPHRFYKVYHSDFAEARKDRFGNVDYLTPARFSKAYNRLLDEGKDRFTLNEYLREVYADVVKSGKGSFDSSLIHERFDAFVASGLLHDVKKHLSR